jgi:hypothetical protein
MRAGTGQPVMGSTKPQLFAINNEETPAPESGGDDPPSGEHPTREHSATERPTAKQASIEEAEGRPVTNKEYRDGRPRWEIAKLAEGEWRRALAHNDREIAEVAPGSPEFARLMEARHRLAFPPPAGIKYDDISKYHAEQVRRELQARLKEADRKKKKPNFDKRWLLLGLGFVGLIVAAAVFLLPEILSDGGAAKGPAPTEAPTAPPVVTTAAPSPLPIQTNAVGTGAVESTASPTATHAPSAAPASNPHGGGQPIKATSAPPATSTPAAPTATSDQSLPYFLPKPKAQ